MPPAVLPCPAAPPARPSDPFADLNPEQRAAVEHGSGEPHAPALLVLAGAGTGKTATLAARVARLMLDGADAQRILLLTFSRRAAGEMQRRVGRTVQRALGLPAHLPPPALPWAGTFHGIGARLLRAHGPAIGLPADFTVIDRGDAEDLMAWVRQDSALAAASRRAPLKGTCLAIYSRAVNGCRSVDEVVRQGFPWCLGWEADLRRLFSAYDEAKATQRLLDYDDILQHWVDLMAAPSAAARVAARFDHVLVDEYQDTNRLQAAILRGLRPDGRGLTVVGDDAQAIYGFRGAELRNILDFPRQFEPPAQVVALERNYRSTQPILDAANAVLAAAEEGFAKRLWTDRAQGERPQLVAVDDEAAQAAWVADDVLRRREQGVALRQQAVLFRAAQHGLALELELMRRGIPYRKYGGLKFLEAAHVKDLLSLLRWADNPRNELAGLRAMQLVAGVGPASARRIARVAALADQPLQALAQAAVPAAAQPGWHGFVALMQSLAAASGGPAWPADWHAALDWYAQQIDRLHQDPATRLADLRQLGESAARHASRASFLTELALDPPEAISDEAQPPHLDEDYLVLSTIHSAKGQEWSAVYVLNAVDGCIPADLAVGNAAGIEEERRLFHVALTRARHALSVVVPRRFFVTEQRALGDRHVHAPASRFLTEAAQACFDRLVPGAGEAIAAGPGAGSAAAPAEPAAEPQQDHPGRRLSARWR